MIRSVISVSLFVIAMFTLAVYTSCEKKPDYVYIDECENVVCENDGVCYSGLCSCVAGFEGESCEKKWISRYIGNWEVTETVDISNKDGRKGTQYNYVMKIAQNGTSNTGILIDNFMGNADYNDVSCRIGIDEDGALATSTVYSFVANQVISNSAITIISGEGTVNFNSTIITGSYEVQYLDATNPDDPKTIQEVISFSGTFVQ